MLHLWYQSTSVSTHNRIACICIIHTHMCQLFVEFYLLYIVNGLFITSIYAHYNISIYIWLSYSIAQIWLPDVRCRPMSAKRWVILLKPTILITWFCDIGALPMVHYHIGNNNLVTYVRIWLVKLYNYVCLHIDSPLFMQLLYRFLDPFH